ncbi:MAG: tetratricopeptide repeat protein, partial [Saprospiraceae bacterium]
AHGALDALPVILLLLLRARVFSQTADNFKINAFDNPIVEATGFGERAATGFMALWQYFRVLVFPHPLVSDYSYRHLTVVDWTNWQALIGLLSVGALAFWAVRGLFQRRPEAFLSGMFLAGIALYSQLLIVIGVLVGERLMYAPSLWFCAGLAFLLLKGTGWDLQQKTQNPAEILAQPGGKAVVWTLALVSVAFSLKTVTRNFDWADNFTLFNADIQHAPGSLRLQNGVGNELLNRIKVDKDLSVAERVDLLTQLELHARAAITIRPEANAYLNLGNAAIIRRQYESAVTMFDSALVFAPNYEPAKRNIAQCYLALGKQEIDVNNNWEKAVGLLKKSVEYNPANPDAYINLGTCYGRMGRPADAIVHFEKATELSPKNLYAWRFLAFAHRTTGNLERAAACEEKVRALETKK